MNRLDFIKSFVSLFGISALPKGWVKQYDKHLLLQCFLRGFKFYEGPKLLADFKEGDMLELVREPENEYDENAVALYWNNHKIGYIPKEENKILSKLLAIGAPEMMAEVTYLKPEAATWENVNLAVYVLKEKNASDIINGKSTYQSTLETPNYYSLRDNKNVVTRITASRKRDFDYYKFLEKHRRDNGIYDMIHLNLSGSQTYGMEEMVFVVKQETLRKKEISLQKQIENMNLLFDEDGYVVLSLEDAEKLVPKISDLGEVVDKMGNTFIELLFREG